MKAFEVIANKIYEFLWTEEYILNLLCQYSLRRSKKFKNYIRGKLKNKKIKSERLIKIVVNNKLSSLVLETLQEIDVFDSLPKNVKENLIKETLITKYLESKRRECSRSILKNLIISKSKFVVMKFYVLGAIFRKELPTRKHEDIDLLVPLSEFRKISKVLFKSGYLYYPESKPVGGLRFVPNEDFHLVESEELFIKSHCNVELHSKIVDLFGFYPPLVPSNKEMVKITQELFDSGVSLNFLGIRIKAFPPTQLVISLFLHSFFHHNMQSRIDYYEMSLILQKFDKEIKWNYILRYLDRYNLKQYFLWYCSLINYFHPGLFTFEQLRTILGYKDSLKVHQQFLFWILKYKVFHPTKFFENSTGRFEKELCWAIIKGKLVRLLLHRMRGIKYPYFKQ